MPWVEVAQSARILRGVLSELGTPRPGSAFADLDEMYPFERASEWTRDFLVAGIEHLELWADYAVPMKLHPEAVVLHRLRPVQALARASIESASHAVWVMAPARHRECILRHLALVVHDFEEHSKALPLGEKHRMRDAKSELESRLHSVAPEAEIPRFPGYMKLVEEASAESAVNGRKHGAIKDPDEVIRLWRSSAGASHGKRWPAEALQTSLAPGDTRRIDGKPANYPDPDAITDILQLADAILTHGVFRYAVYCGYEPQLNAMMAQVGDALLRSIPRKP